MRWTFRVVRADYSSAAVRRVNGQDTLDGTADEALAFAERVREHLAARESVNSVARVEAHSVLPDEEAVDAGPTPSASAGEPPTADDEPPPSSSAPRWTRFVLRPKGDVPGWRFDDSHLAHRSWHRSIDEAVSYAAFRGRGWTCEIRAVGRNGRLLRLVLVDQTDLQAFAGLTPSCQKRSDLKPSGTPSGS